MEPLPEEVLVRVAHHLTLRQRGRIACANRAWRAAAAIDASQSEAAGPAPEHLTHLALITKREQMRAAASPTAALARSADLPARGAATRALLGHLSRVQRLALTAADPLSLMAALPAPVAVEDLDLLLLPPPSGRSSSGGGGGDAAADSTNGPWTAEALGALARSLSAGLPRLRALSLRCSAAAAFEGDGAVWAPLAALSALTRVELGPAPPPAAAAVAPPPPPLAGDAATAAAAAASPSPLGFGRPPAFLGALPRLCEIGLALADTLEAPIEAETFDRVSRATDAALTLRADTGPRIVSVLPMRLSAVSGLTRLTVQSFCFEDVGGWCSRGVFDASPLTRLPLLRDLALALRTWGCEHLDTLELRGLERLTQLRRLLVTVTCAPTLPAASRHDGGATGEQELRLSLPLVAETEALPAVDSADGSSTNNSSSSGMEELSLACSCALVIGNSCALAAAASVAALARSLTFEERPAATAAATPTPHTTTTTTPAAAAPATTPAAAAPATTTHNGAPLHVTVAAPRGASEAGGSGSTSGGGNAQPAVRAPASLVVQTLPDLWPSAEVWTVPVIACVDRTERRWWEAAERVTGAELLCTQGTHEAALADLGVVLTEGMLKSRWGKLTRTAG